VKQKEYGGNAEGGCVEREDELRLGVAVVVGEVMCRVEDCGGGAREVCAEATLCSGSEFRDTALSRLNLDTHPDSGGLWMGVNLGRGDNAKTVEPSFECKEQV